MLYPENKQAETLGVSLLISNLTAVRVAGGTALDQLVLIFNGHMIPQCIVVYTESIVAMIIHNLCSN